MLPSNPQSIWSKKMKKLLSSILPLKMETLEEEQQQSPASDDQSSQPTMISRLLEYIISILSKLIRSLNITKQKPQLPPNDNTLLISLPEDIIITEILSRLPVKTLIKLRPVSKPYSPSFTRLQFTHAIASNRTALLISAYDTYTRQRYLLSATSNGGPVIVVATPHACTVTNRETTEMEHVHGLVLFSSGNGFVECNFAYVINPGTRKIFKLLGPGSNPMKMRYGVGHICYFFGYDESMNEHKVLTIRMLDVASMKPFVPKRIEIMLFYMLSLTWRNINIDGLELGDDVIREWNIGTKHGICVDSVIHVILQSRNEILAFDLRTEKFSIIKFPDDAIRDATSYYKKGLNTILSNQPFLMKINGYLGLMCHNPAAGVDEMDIWILKDYEKRIWVWENVGFLKSWFVLDGPIPLNSFLRKDGVVTQSGSSTRLINTDMYDVESKSFKSVDFILGYEFLHPSSVRFDHVRRYTESILSLPRN
ncbi:F-box protein At1g30790-like [Bidens hawaiensis]|uniref:F-box protein At1g30790-like n=1 Tax=Bidens hawaiensis TaxID=980011 RepID=UPI004049009B